MSKTSLMGRGGVKGKKFSLKSNVTRFSPKAYA